jgi:methyltransferase (TIGR00027 family)
MARPDRASVTAQLAALGRASGTREAEAIRCADPLAERFLDRRFRLLLAAEPVRRVARAAYMWRAPGLYGFIIAKTRLFDEMVRAELAAGAEQLVILGAGYDSRAYRLVDGGRVTVFEVDAPPTSASKRARVRALFGREPAHVRYVAVDFNKETAEGPLQRAGFDPARRTAFLWEAVMCYLEADAVDAVLAFVRRCTQGTSLAFDYVFRSAVLGTSTAFGAAEGRAFVARRGEPFTFGLEEGALDAFFAPRGFAVASNVLPAELEDRYMRGASRAVVYRVAGYLGVALVRVA